jgi:flagellar biosynthesis protein FlhA
MVGPPEERQLAMAPGKLQEFVRKLNEIYEKASSGGEIPVVLCGGAIRAQVRAIIERVKPGTAVLSQLEIFPRARIRTVGTV